MKAFYKAIEELKTSNEGLNSPKLIATIDALAAEIEKLKAAPAKSAAKTSK